MSARVTLSNSLQIPASGVTATKNITVTYGTQALYFFLTSDSEPADTTCTFNGVAATTVKQSTGSAAHSHLRRLDAPDPGTYAWVVSAADVIGGGAIIVGVAGSDYENDSYSGTSEDSISPDLVVDTTNNGHAGGIVLTFLGETGDVKTPNGTVLVSEIQAPAPNPYRNSSAGWFVAAWPPVTATWTGDASTANSLICASIPPSVPNRAVLNGVDITSRVVSFGTLEEIKEILLATATMFTAEQVIEVRNDDLALSLGTSLAAGIDWYGKTLEIIVDGVTMYEGYITKIEPNAESGTAFVTSQNIMRKAAEQGLTFTETELNPGDALAAILLTAFSEDQLDLNSIRQSGGPARAAGAKINCNWPQGNNTSVMQAVQEISTLCSISVFVVRNRVIARPWKAYQGSSAGLKWPMIDAAVRQWGKLEYDTTTFNNRVTVGNLETAYETLEDFESYRRNGRVWRTHEFSASGSVVALDRASARFFGKTYLERCANRVAKLMVTGGDNMANIVLGDRFPVTQSTRLGLSSKPMEVYTVRRNLDTRNIELGLVEVFA